MTGETGHKAYQLSSDGTLCTQLCSWRPDSIFCYPGRCTHNTPSSCTCAPGFGGSNCLTINTAPAMTSCSGKLKSIVGGTERDTIEASCMDTGSPSTVWTNIASDPTGQIQFQVDWETSFQGPSATDWPRQYYIHDHGIGVISASVDWWLERARGGTRVSSGTLSCADGGISRDSPNPSPYCNSTVTMAVPPQHGDSLFYTTKSTNGGYVKVRNYDRTSGYTVNPPVYLAGREVSHTAHFTFDTRSPHHCSKSGGCADNMLDRGPAITKNGNIRLRWSDWSDDDSGIKQYVCEVFLLERSGEELQEKYPAVAVGRHGPDTTEMDVVLTEAGDTSLFVRPGVYSVVLTVEDSSGPNDGNFITARRFLIFDNNSTVETDTSGHFPLWVDSVANNSAWQTDLQDVAGNGPKVQVKWSGHFFNSLHRDNKFLNPIKEHHPPITTGYEELTGLPPATRSREAVPNVAGIVIYQTAWGVDHQGGRTLTAPADNWDSGTDVLAEQKELDIARQDGDTIRVWVRAFDVMGNAAEDSVTVHVDSSPPVLDNMTLSFQQGTGAGNNHPVISGIKVLFTAYDDHSGLQDIHWELHDLADTSVVHGEGQITVRKTTVGDPGCQSPQCICIPKDGGCYFHNYELFLDMDNSGNMQSTANQTYYFIITVTNNAMLKTWKILPVKDDSNTQFSVGNPNKIPTVHNGKCHWFSDDSLSQEEASTACTDMKGRLIDINDESEQQILVSYIPGTSGVSYWTAIKSRTPDLFYPDGSQFSPQSSWMSGDPYAPCDVCVLLDSASGYKGQYHSCSEHHSYVCESDVQLCSPNVCLNGGNCTWCFSDYSMCDCPSGYTGDFCETDIDVCSSSPCQNGGTCVDDVDSFSCTCAHGYTGSFCEADIDWCDPNPCPSGWNCVDGLMGFHCADQLQ
ncbi:PREDICTED: uncharacterized protein LOC109484117 [Branchiostoma belcheri]|uniref:Uncharacterized protein LOC109484117 n=1 Tax=Branchiostoma belcheri TaxID=7741 RepID=A0A6P5AI76_BRABE|nr:PREDICTED: uncharacterized protein LOC109484117 [Branchiostoma belcheri]